MKNVKQNVKYKKDGFTLIELLAVIIILGILMIIAIPSVTSYINNSRKSAYVDTAKEIISGARNFVNEGKLEMYDTGTTYYIDYGCVKTENASKSPYGDFDKAYVIVTYDGKGYNYYWVSRDETGQGVATPVSINSLDEDDIKSDLAASDINTDIPIGSRTKTQIINSSCAKEEARDADTTKAVPDYGTTPVKIACKRATTLHEEACTYACQGAGIANGTIMKYGNDPATVTSGTLTPGDAFDCDVNNDGNFNATNERFYYIGTSDSGNALMLYYSNTDGATPTTTTLTAYASVADAQTKGTCTNSNGCNWYGPLTAIKKLPTTSDWTNPAIVYPTKRAIIGENYDGKVTTSSTTTAGGTLPTDFDYTGYAGRLITVAEVQNACGASTASNPMTNGGYLDSCTYTIENTMYGSNVPTYGYWTDAPYAGDSQGSWYLNGSGRYVGIYFNVSYASYSGARPVIEIQMSAVEK